MINHHPSAAPGSVLTLPYYSPSTFPPSSAILCRNTAPLISFAYGLLQRKVSCHVLGREIGQGLITLIDKMTSDTIEALLQRLETYRQRETAKALAKFDEALADSIEDRCTCIRIFCNGLGESDRSISTLKRNITTLFSDDNTEGKVTLSTVHKSKGLEYPTVFILDRGLMPSKWAKSDWQIKQETNLIYVAVTRAKLDLRYIESGYWRAEPRPGEVKKPEAWELD